jgi:CRISPR-associated endonuclease/helicase Cas3
VLKGDVWFAHSTADPSKADWEPLAQHLVETRDRAVAAATDFGGQRAAEMAALLHDIGKYTVAFQRRLEGGKAVDHSTAGAAIVMEAPKVVDAPFRELIAQAIAGHHAGLPDRRGAGSLDERLRHRPPDPDPVWRGEITLPEGSIRPPLDLDQSSVGFQLGVFGRMLFSSLVEADFLATEAFYAAREAIQPDRDWPTLGGVLDDLIARFDAHMSGMSAVGPVNALRAEVLAHVRGKAASTPGVFKLTVPTGGGKTLASLGFALDHARRHGLRRIVYAIPFTSVIDQTATTFRAVLGDGVVLEHHSAIEIDRRPGQAERDERRERGAASDKLRLAMENWAAPVVVTTNVQLFESLFAARPSRCRKLHNLAGSVLVLDEAQTIPRPLLRPCVAMLKELARNYGVSIVLCTATQPALGAPPPDGGPGFPDGLPLTPERELAPDPPRLFAALRRTTLDFVGAMEDAALVDALRETPQGLVIVNSRAHALALFRAVRDAGLDGAIHLTTRQYAAHRRRILADVRTRLSGGAPCRLIATSLVEAGVDLDFPRVWRAEAGLDQIAQAAGRCNREGRRDRASSVVTVFEAERKPPREIALLAGDLGRMRARHEDLFTPEALTDYFGEVYWRVGAEGLDEKDILGDHAYDFARNEVDIAFRTIAEKFRMIESGIVPVIIPRDPEALAALDALRRRAIGPGEAARKLQTHLVQIPPDARELMLRNGHVAFETPDRFGDQFAVLQKPSLYDHVIGLIWEDADYLGLEGSVI